MLSRWQSCEFCGTGEVCSPGSHRCEESIRSPVYGQWWPVFAGLLIDPNCPSPGGHLNFLATVEHQISLSLIIYLYMYIYVYTETYIQTYICI